MNGLEKVVDLLVAVCLLFLTPLLYYEGVRNSIENAILKEAGERFLRRVSTAGEITEAVLKQLEWELWQCGCENYELVRERTLYEPEEEAGVRKVEVIEDKKEIYMQVEEAGASKLQRGDKLWLTIYTRGVPSMYFETVRTGEAYS